MANTLAAIMPKILARGLLTLRERAIMPRLVNGDYSSDAAERGDTIDVPISSAITVIDVAPSNTPPAGADTIPNKVQVQLNNWKQNTPFYLSDKDLVEVDRNEHFLPMQVAEAVKGLANAVNASIWAEYKGVYGQVGTAGTAPFGSGVGVQSATNVRKVLNQQLCPRDLRRGVLDFTAEAAALALPEFSNAEQILSNTVRIEGEIGRKYGIDWYADDAVPFHTSTPLSAGAATVNGAHAVGAGSTDGGRTGTVSIAKATNSSPLVQGDLITFAGDSQSYVVLANVTLAVGNTSVSIAPALKVAKSGGEAMTLTASHRVNLVFHRDAFAFATRPLVANTDEFSLGNQILSLQDPVTGLVMRLEVSRQYKRVAWEFDILWGVKLVRPEMAVRLLG